MACYGYASWLQKWIVLGSHLEYLCYKESQTPSLGAKCKQNNFRENSKKTIEMLWTLLQTGIQSLAQEDLLVDIALQEENKKGAKIMEEPNDRPPVKQEH